MHQRKVQELAVRTSNFVHVIWERSTSDGVEIEVYVTTDGVIFKYVALLIVT